MVTAQIFRATAFSANEDDRLFRSIPKATAESSPRYRAELSKDWAELLCRNAKRSDSSSETLMWAPFRHCEHIVTVNGGNEKKFRNCCDTSHFSAIAPDAGDT